MQVKSQNKIFQVAELVPIIESLKQNNQKIVFTNGCFDLIHTGHTRYLQAAREAGDGLIVAVNSDRSVRQLKGNQRPVIPLEERMEVLAGFYFVDFVVPFDEPDPYNTIKQLKPNILIKGGDWPIEKIIGREIVEKEGGRVFTIPVIPGRSTSGIISKILMLHSKTN
jgi:D-beta-D-heptose 7-phosphate kinase/D-beta-D-heptose 1-phosphate adenosyltransferase